MILATCVIVIMWRSCSCLFIQTTQKKQEGELLDHRQWIGDATCPKCFPDISDKKTVKI